MSDAIDRAAEAKVRELEHDRNLWRERAENGEPRPEVTKDDIAKAIRDGLYDDVNRTNAYHHRRNVR